MKLLIVFCITLLFSCSHQKTSFPSDWWKPIEGKKKWWEIAPDAAKSGEVILSKRNELGILSNFANTPFELDGKKYQSFEGFWQAMKYPESVSDARLDKRVDWPHRREQVEQMVGHEAKKAGSIASENMKKLGINWVTYRGKKMEYRTSKKGEHYKTIRRAMVAKLRQNSDVYHILLKTKDLILRPDHITKPTDPPAWKYYQIWMELRDKIQNKEELK